MNITIKATNIELAETIRDYATRKIESLEKIIKNNEAMVAIEVGKISNHHKTGIIYRAEVNISVNGKHFRAVSAQEDIYTAIDDVRDELQREMTSRKDKTMRLFKKGAKKVKEMVRFWK